VLGGPGNVDSVLYVRLEFGSNKCEEGLDIADIDECRKAMSLLQLPQMNSDDSIVVDSSQPCYCSVQADSVNALYQMRFNEASNGHANSASAPLCRANRLIAV